MLSHYKILTVTHKTVSQLQQLEHYVIPGDAVHDTLQDLKVALDLDEIQYLATCNRVLYFFYTPQVVDSRFINRFFQIIHPGEPDLKVIQNLEGEAAIRHLHKVAASIDSMVVGEREILRQLREAYERCHEWGLTADHLRLAIQSAVVAAKDVYAHTRIGEKPVSVVSLAIQKLLDSRLPHDARIQIGRASCRERV